VRGVLLGSSYFGVIAGDGQLMFGHLIKRWITEIHYLFHTMNLVIGSILLLQRCVCVNQKMCCPFVILISLRTGDKETKCFRLIIKEYFVCFTLFFSSDSPILQEIMGNLFGKRALQRP